MKKGNNCNEIMYSWHLSAIPGGISCIYPYEKYDWKLYYYVFENIPENYHICIIIYNYEK